MIFEGLSGRIQKIIGSLTGSGKISEKDIKETIKEVRRALLEADVNFSVVKNFTNKISEKALGHEVLKSLTPGQQIVDIIHQELVALLGGKKSDLNFSSTPPSIYMIVGLQGSGKTTSAGKLANWVRKQGKRPLLVACDIYRPAAIKQLEVLGSQLNVPVFSMGTDTHPVDISKNALAYAKSNLHDVIIVDTAGRLHIDDELMEELANVKSVIDPTSILLVLDSMMGQDSVNVAKSFHDKLGIDSVILTKLDGDTRGGAALSIKEVTGCEIKFVGMGEKLSDLEPFFPDRMASRILGMGDMLTLIEKAKENFDEQNAIEMEKKLRSQQFTLDDFLDQMQQLKKMGPLNQIISMLPGVDSNMLKKVNIDDKDIARVEAIIRSMTKKERQDCSILNKSRKIRIANGSGTDVHRVNKLITDFENMKKMLKIFSNGGNPMGNLFGSKKRKPRWM